MLNVAYAYLAEQATAEDAAAVPAYEMGGVEEKDIKAASRRAALDAWLDAPEEDVQRAEQAVVAYLTS